MVNNELLRRVGIKENFVESKRKAFKESYFDIAINYKKATISMENTNLKNSINEIITFKSGHSEGFGEKVKAGWDTFIEKLKKLWHNFIDGCQALIKKITGFFLKRKVENIKKKYLQLSHLDLSKGDITVYAANSILDLMDLRRGIRDDEIIDDVIIKFRNITKHLHNHLINFFKDVDKIIKNPNSMKTVVTDGLIDTATDDFNKYRQELKEAVNKIAKEEKDTYIISEKNLEKVKKTAKDLMKAYEDEYSFFAGQLTMIDELMSSKKDVINELHNVIHSSKEDTGSLQSLYATIRKVEVDVILNIKEITKEFSTFLSCIDITTNLDQIYNGKARPSKDSKNSVKKA
jgi:hypothetical protein